MKKTAIAAVSIALGVVLASCASGPHAATAPVAGSMGGASIAPETPSATADPAPKSTPSASPIRSTRGNLIKHIGVTAKLLSEDGADLVSFVVTDMEVDPQCTGASASQPENGHFVVLTVEAQTTPALAKMPNPSFFIGSGVWKAISADGRTQNQHTLTAAAFSCLGAADNFPQMLGPDEKASGKIVFDVVSPSGTLILANSAGPGWEWHYPEN